MKGKGLFGRGLVYSICIGYYYYYFYYEDNVKFIYLWEEK